MTDVTVTVIYQYLKSFICVQKNNLRLIQNCYQQNVFTNYIYSIYLYKEDLALNNLQWLICHEIQTNNNCMMTYYM